MPKLTLEKLAGLAKKERSKSLESQGGEVTIVAEEELRQLKQAAFKHKATENPKRFQYDSTAPIDPMRPFASRRLQSQAIDPRFSAEMSKDAHRNYLQNYSFIDDLRDKEFAVGKRVLKSKKLGKGERAKIEKYIQHIASENNLRKRVSKRLKSQASRAHLRNNR